MRTVAFDCATCRIVSKTSCIGAEFPMIFSMPYFAFNCAFNASFSCSTVRLLSNRFIMSSSLSRCNGLVMKSVAPRCIASTASSTSPYAVRIITNNPGIADCACSMSSKPSIPGIRRSLMSISTDLVCKSASASSPEAAHNTSYSRRKSRSRPSRALRSSSTNKRVGLVIFSISFQWGI